MVNAVATVKAYSESAQKSATDSQTYATTAGAKASEASTEASNAHNSATASASSATVSRNWAIKLDAPVEGTDYSSKYYAQKAQESATTATTKATEASASATTATTKATEASASATSASTSANTATTKATSASSSAERADNGATNSLAYAELSKKWAIQTDTPVEGSLYGAKYYAERAASGQVQANWAETDETSKAFILNKPTKVSAFANDKGYLTEHQSLAGYATETFVNDAVSTSENKAYNDYGTLG